MAKIIRAGTMVCLLVFILVVSQEVQVVQADIDCSDCSKGTWVEWWICISACQCSLGYCSEVRKVKMGGRKELMNQKSLNPSEVAN